MNSNFQKQLSEIMEHVQVDSQESAQWEEEEKNRAREEWFKKSGIPQEFFGAALSSPVYQQETAKKIAKFIDGVRAGDGGFLVLMGTVGTGKTYTACAVLQELGKGTFLDMLELKLKLNTADRYNAAENREMLLHRLAGCSVLALDEIGRFGNAQEQETLFYLLNKRYSSNRPAILSTNLNPKEFAEYVGQAVIDRIKSKCVFVEFKGESLRGKNGIL